MKAIRNKLISRRGASITFALLLFLVCAVLSSVIIAASTAAAGRMSRAAEMDQRYYAVTSAAEFLKDLMLDDAKKEVSVVKVETYRTTDTYQGDVYKGSSTSGPTQKFYLVEKGADAVDLDWDLNDSTQINGTMSFSSLQGDLAYKIYQMMTAESGTVSVPGAAKYTLSTSESGADNALAATINEMVDEDYGVTFTVYNTYDVKGSASAPGTRYTLELHFTFDGADLRNESDPKLITSTSDDYYGYYVSEDVYCVDSTTTTYTIAPFTWRLDSITVPSGAD